MVNDHNLFFTYQQNVTDRSIILSGREFHHIKHVLRFKKGDNVDFTDGQGNLFRTQIIKLDKNQIACKVISKKHIPQPTTLALDIAFVPLKGARNDVIIEKGTELGIGKFRPFISQFSVKKSFALPRIDRLNRIAKSAMLQSKQYYLPEIIFHKDIDSLLKVFKNYDLVLIADKKGQADTVVKAHSVLLVVGPEGGFDQAELDKFTSLKGRLLSLGINRLRSETAAIVGLAKVLTMYNAM
jgi:16S rRNA (uracil1498-N3)-methyltransferase